MRGTLACYIKHLFRAAGCTAVESLVLKGRKNNGSFRLTLISSSVMSPVPGRFTAMFDMLSIVGYGLSNSSVWVGGGDWKERASEHARMCIDPSRRDRE